MTPKEKAIELVEKFRNLGVNNYEYKSKQCALIAVDEIMKAHAFDKMYWEEVKQEIKKL